MAFPRCLRFALLCALCCGSVDVARAAPTLGICLAGNSDRLSSDNCRCTGAASTECIGSCVANRCTGATTVDPPICAGPNNAGNSSPNGCSCAVNGDCSGDCSGGVCINGTNTAICEVPGNLNNVSADGCPCNVNGDCTGNCNSLTRTCEGVVGAVFDRQPLLSAVVTSQTILLGETTALHLTLTNAIRSASTLRSEVFGPGDLFCMNPLFDTTTAPTAATVITSASFQPATTGGYRWRAFYRGNAWNLATAESCFDPDQHVIVDTILLADGFES